jgi:nicotinate-nucleotide pyrophosphorylase (carboxylating)
MTYAASLPEVVFLELVRKALAEDLGSGGDITSDRMINQEIDISAKIVARQQGVLAGDKVAALTFDMVDSSLSIDWEIFDGQLVLPDTTVAVVTGTACSILQAERTALNFLSHLSGVASATHEMVATVAGTGAKICCTRKTTPGLRALEKYAVRVGGGVNHRYSLDGGILIKDNHVAISGGISSAFKKINDIGPDIGVQIEVDTLEQLREALHCGARSILLDNMDNTTLSAAVEINKGKAVLEASGNVTLDSVGAIAATGVDYISSGWITHSSPSLDFGLDLIE